jgi:uncharacterized protein YbbC (DUF1343 family)
MTHHFQTGLDRCLAEPLQQLQAARLGLLMNQASVDHQLGYACDAIAKRYPGQLAAIFSPQHGLWGEQQANMIESDHVRHGSLAVPVYSLYSETRRPTPSMLADIDCLLVDLQDVGTRVYTFLWTLLECLIACSHADVRVIVLDRPNPIGGDIFEGPLLVRGFESFVGGNTIPLRHGLTLAEIAQLLVAEMKIAVELQVVPMLGWKRAMLFSELGRPWIWPSPNMPCVSTALLYPGQVLLEGTNLSEGRGTTRPFELVGAPFLDQQQFCDELLRIEHKGLHLRPLRFSPTFDKWKDQSCGGVDLHIHNPREVRSVRTTVTMLAAAAKLAPSQFAWLPPPYEYEYQRPPIDILFGSPELRKVIDGVRDGTTLSESALDQLLEFDEAGWRSRIEPCFL